MSEEMVLRLGFQYMGESQAKRFIASLTDAQKKAVEAAYGVDDLNTALKDGVLVQKEYSEVAAKGGEAMKALTVGTTEYMRALRDTGKARAEFINSTKNLTLATDADTEAIIANNKQNEEAVRIANARIKQLEAEAAAQKKKKDEIKHVTEAQMQQNLADQAAFQQMSAAKNLELARTGYSKSYLRLNQIAAGASPALERIATLGGAAILGAAYEGVKTYANINKVVTQSVTQAGLDKKDLNYYQQGILQISQETGQSAQDLAEALYRVASGTAGWTGRTKKTILDITKNVSDLTTLGNIKSGVQQEQAARVITALVNSGLKDVGHSSRRAAALVNAAVGAGDIKPSEMVSAMGRGTLLAAKAHGIGAADAMAWVDLLTSTGTTGSVAGTYVKSGFSQFLTPTSQGEKAYAMIGVSSATLQQLAATKGLGAAVAYFDQHLKSFNPFTNYPKTKGASGQAGAIKQLEMWTANQFPPKLLAEWKSGFKGMKGQELKNAQDAVFSLIATKAFGGSKGFTTMAALLENLPGFLNIRSAIARNSNEKQYNQSVQMALNTPAAQFNRIKNTLIASLVDIGRTLTPFALTLGKFLAGLTSFVTHFKPILESVLGIIGVAIASVLKAKTAGLLMKAYPILGNEIRSLDKFMGKIGMGEKWAKVGPEFRKHAELAQLEKEEKLGKIYAKFGEDVVFFNDKGVATFVGAVNAFAEGTTVSGAGGVASAEKAAAGSAAHIGEKDVAFLQKYMEGGELQGKRITKTAIGEHYGVDRRSKAAGEIFDRLQSNGLINDSFSPAATSKIRGAAGAAETAVKEVGAAEKIAGAAGGVGKIASAGMGSFAGELIGGAGSMLGSTLGMLTGPVGMGVMAMLPLAMPLISTGLRNLTSWMSGSQYDIPKPPPVYSGTLNDKQLAAKVKADKATLNQLYVKLNALDPGDPKNESKRTALISQIGTLNEQISAETSTSASRKTTPGQKQYIASLVKQKNFFDKFGKSIFQSTGSTDMVSGWTTATGLYHKMGNTPYAITPEMFKQKYGKGMPADIYNTYKKMYYKYFKDGRQSSMFGGEKNIHNFVNAFKQYASNYRTQTNADLGVTAPIVGALNPAFAANQLISGQNSKLSYWKNRIGNKKFGTKMNKSDAINAFLSLQQEAGSAAYNAAVDRAYAADASIPAAQREQYARQAQKMNAQAAAFEKAATALAQKKGLKPDDIKGIGDAMANAIYRMYQTYGIGASARDIAVSFQAALGNSGAGLASIVNKHNANIILRGSM